MVPSLICRDRGREANLSSLKNSHPCPLIAESSTSQASCYSLQSVCLAHCSSSLPCSSRLTTNRPPHTVTSTSTIFLKWKLTALDINPDLTLQPYLPTPSITLSSPLGYLLPVHQTCHPPLGLVTFVRFLLFSLENFLVL